MRTLILILLFIVSTCGAATNSLTFADLIDTNIVDATATIDLSAQDAVVLPSGTSGHPPGVPTFGEITYTGTSVAWVATAANVQYVALTNNANIGFPSSVAQGSDYTLILQQGTGGTKVVSWNGGYDWGADGVPTLSTIEGREDSFEIFCRSSTQLYARLLSANMMAWPAALTSNTLTVATDWATATPAAGVTWYTNNSIVDADINGSPVVSGDTQYVSLGWTGTGDVTASGSTTNTSFTITQTSTLTWNWQTQFQFQVSAAVNGSVDVADAFKIQGSNFTVTATADSGYSFTEWTGDIATNTAAVNVTMNAPVDLTAVFTADPDPALVLHWDFAATNSPTLDATTNGNNGTLNNAPTYVAQIASISPHYSFASGSSQTIETTNLTPAISSFPVSVELWWKTDASGTYVPFFLGQGANTTNQFLSLLSGGSIIRQEKTHGGVKVKHDYSGAAYYNDAWHHMAMVWSNGVSSKIYLDGTLVKSIVNVNATNVLHSLPRFLLGAWPGAYYMEGEMTDVKIFNDIRLSNDVYTAFNNSKSSKGYLTDAADTNSPFIAYLMEYDGVSADGSGNNNEGALSGATFAVYTNGAEKTGYYNLDDINDDIISADNVTSDNADARSAMFWFKRTNTNSVDTIMEYGVNTANDMYSITWNTGQQLELSINGAYLQWDNVASGGTGWTHVVFTTGAASLDTTKLYVNGVDQGAADTDVGGTNVLTTTASVLYLGRNIAGGERAGGSIDNVRLYDHELSAPAASNLYTDTEGSYIP